ncbi:MAG: hypothetical protein GKR94_24465 [Gammaproteobacteria bacterium]|nr:hypothetical protein [Gammaproteobacteria bacterium]
MHAAEVCADLRENHQRKVSRGTLQLLAESVDGITQLHEENWHYETSELDCAIKTVVCSLEEVYLLTAHDRWREAMGGTLSLYDVQVERQHTVYIGAAPEYGKATFFQRYQQELDRIKALYPKACYLGIADGATSNGAFLNQQTDRQRVDYYHVTEYLAKAAYAAYPEKTGKPARQQWLTARCHQLKHDTAGAQAILAECRTLKRKRSLSEGARTDLEATITYFAHQMDKLDYATHTREQ